ncbi:MAG: putative DNA-binding domain-containing protein [Hyphomonadaceae bacterium]
MSDLGAFQSAFAETASGSVQAPNLFWSADDPGLRVYRNNVVSAVASALGSGFPALRRLVGEDFFLAMSAAYFDAHPPGERTLVAYGEWLPKFIKTIPQVEASPFLGDVARLDRAWLDAHIAADQRPLHVDDLVDLDGEALARLRVALHPSVQIVRTDWSCYEIWLANREGGASALAPRTATRTSETILIWRASGEVISRHLSATEAAFLGALLPSGTLQAAAEGVAGIADADLSAIFASALASSVLVSADGEPHD